MLKSIKSLNKPKNVNKTAVMGQELMYYNDFWSNYKEYNKIEKGLFLGSDAPVKDGLLMEMLEIADILSITENPLPLSDRFNQINYTHIEAGDFPDQDLLSNFDECFKIINNAQKSGNNIYIHCGAGVSRSATIVIAFVMKKYKLSTVEAIRRVSKKRKVFPNEGFIDQLDLYEKMNFMTNGNCEDYRRFLLKCLTYKLRTGNTLYLKNEFKTKVQSETQIQMSLNYEQNYVRNYFDKMAISELMVVVDKGHSYHCFICNTELFNEINIIGDEESKRVANSSCDNIFIEPLQTYCTKSVNDKTGYLNCPNCLQRFGSYNWLLYECNCTSHFKWKECLALRVFRHKISY